MDTAIMNLRNENENHYYTEKKKFEAEIVDLLNEAARLRNDNQKKSEIISELDHKISKLEVMPMKL